MNQSSTPKLNIVLGLGRSGTTWLSYVLASSITTSTSFYRELLTGQPSIDNHYGLSFTNDLLGKVGLKEIYEKAFSNSTDLWTDELVDYVLIRHEESPTNILIKEVHALLGTEFLIHSLDATFLLIVRDPIYSIDSLLEFNKNRFNSNHINIEYNSINDEFLNRFLPSNSIYKVKQKISYIDTYVCHPRKKFILKRLLTYLAITEMFIRLASENKQVKLVFYENLCSNPLKIFKECADWFKIDLNCSFVNETISGTKEESKIHRMSNKQLTREYKSLVYPEVHMCYNFIEECELQYPIKLNHRFAEIKDEE